MWKEKEPRDARSEWGWNLFIFLSVFTYFESTSGRGREKESESQAGSALSARSPARGSNPQTMRSWPEPKSRVGRPKDWATQVPPGLEFKSRCSGRWRLSKPLRARRMNCEELWGQSSPFEQTLVIYKINSPCLKIKIDFSQIAPIHFAAL